MNSRTTINLSLLALVAILGTLAYFKPGIEKPAEPASITSIKPADVAKIRIDRTSLENVAFERRDGKWWMSEPVKTLANPMRMEGVLRIAETKSKRQYPAAQADLTKIGLEQPDITLSLNDGTKIAFGDTEPLTHSRYVRVGDTVHLIDDTSYYHVVGAYTTFIDNALVPDDAVIEGITLPGLKLSRAEDHWRAVPEPSRFSVDRVNLLLDEWRHVQATEVQRFNGSKSEGEVVLAIKDRPEPLRFAILSRKPELILARTDLGLQYHLPEDSADRLLKLPEPAAETEQPSGSTTSKETK